MEATRKSLDISYRASTGAQHDLRHQVTVKSDTVNRAFRASFSVCERENLSDPSIPLFVPKPLINHLTARPPSSFVAPFTPVAIRLHFSRGSMGRQQCSVPNGSG